MACSKESEKIELKDDLEVEETLSKNSSYTAINDPSLDYKEKPLSPVLTGGLINRKFLIGRRSKLIKSRVRLSDRFKNSEGITQNPSEVPPSDINISKFIDDSFTVSQSENLVDQIEKLEELESKRQYIYKKLVVSGKNNDLCFKKPISPAPHKVKRIKIPDKDHKDLDITESEHNEEKTSPRTCLFPSECEGEPVTLPKCSGFQTATGRRISLSEHNLQKHSKLFDDILHDNPSLICEIQSRNNKYAFLRKINSFTVKGDSFRVTARSALSESDITLCKSSENVLESTQAECNHNIPLEGFKSASGSAIKVSQSALKHAKSIFGDEQFIDINCEQFKTDFEADKVISLTQEICESGISNTQMLCAVDDVLSSVECNKNSADFKGFEKEEVVQHRDLLLRFIHVYNRLRGAGSLFKNFNESSSKRSIFSITRTCNSRIIEGREEFNNSKRVVDLPLPPKKRVKNDDELRNVANWTPHGEHGEVMMNFKGFSSAAGKPITVSDTSLKKARNIFDDIDSNLHVTKLKEIKIDNNGASFTAFGDFSSASGKSISISEDSLKRARNIFENLDLEHCEENLTTTVSNIKKPVSDKSGSFEKVVKDCKIENSRNESGITPVLIKNENNNMNEKVFEAKLNFPDTFSSVKCGFQTAGGSKLKISEEALRKAQRAYDTEQQEIADPIAKSEDANLTLKRKRRLGVSSCKQLQISDGKLEKAKLFFDEDFSKLSPMRPRYDNIYASTPIGQNACSTPTKNDLRPSKSDTFTPIGHTSCVTPVRNDLLKPAKSFNSFFETASITPIKVDDVGVNFPANFDSKVALMSPTKGGVADWMNELEVGRKKLEDRLRIITERQAVMERLLQPKMDSEKRPWEGILYQTKKSILRMSLSCFVNNKKPGEENTNLGLFYINPQNAENVHFKGLSSAVIITKDGATIVPNLKDNVGLSEIEIAFQSMPGVDPRLIPNYWLRNHYKWIVWKLASYERMFPAQFRGCLCVENVTQQLKYRYDREIDKAERSALRKIYEKDDTPRKRMVLCVSGIKEVNTNQYELELSDGWYKIRTIIDEPLCNQIARGKVRIGTKLLVFGADLLNCDGCHPLECTDLTCLRINFNSTRRAHWHAKLGYQRHPGPFAVQIQSVHPLGGPIGAIKICIVRTYPFKFLERLEGRSVWRNKRAEEMRAHEWESERCKALEKVHENVRKEFDDSQEKHNVNLGKRYNNNVSGITCPETLCEIINNSNDPDCVESLSSSQRAAVLKYQSNLSEKKQHEIAKKISKDVSKLKLTKRDVVGILKLLVVDVDDTPDRAYSFFVWQPNESHMQVLRERTVVTVQNVLPRKNGDLNSYAKTMFRPEPSTFYANNKLERRLTEIVELTRQDFPPKFNEFDTVGIVVNIDVDVRSQEVWLADGKGRLLFVTIYEGPSTCLLLDNLKKGQATTVCNLVYRGIKEDVVQALANHFTVFSCYSQYRHLQERLEVFKKELPKDVDALINNCDRKIELFRLTISNSRNGFEDSDEDTLVSSRITSTDVALSLIDLDKFM